MYFSTRERMMQHGLEYSLSYDTPIHTNAGRSWICEYLEFEEELFSVAKNTYRVSDWTIAKVGGLDLLGSGTRH